MNHRLLQLAGKAWIYVLLAGGAALFSWPFLWMATTSVKLDREMFGERLHLLPQRPDPRPQSPYVDARYFQDVPAAPALEQQLAGLDYPWPTDVDRAALIREVAKGVYRKLTLTLPADQVAAGKADKAMVDEVVPLVRRHLNLGVFTARSYAPVTEDALPANWQVTGNAKLVDGDLVYDLAGNDTVTLAQTFTTSFPVQNLHRLQLGIRSDDTWHAVNVTVEKLGVKLVSARAFYLADFNVAVATWQEPGPDDLTNKIRSWTLLQPAGQSEVTGPNGLRVTIELKRNSALGAWWAKARRNYRFALDHIPFWRYVGTSLFLVILNIVGTLASCSLVAYSFARLQWPGRNFCFGLMLATMMIPGQVTMIPYFLIIRALGWYNTLYPLWVGHFFAGAFNVFLLRQFLRGIPRDLEDAAKIDGCGFWRVYWHLMLPLVKPTLAAIAIFTFMGTWNDFMGPLIYLSDQRLYPLSLGLFALNVQAGGGASSMGLMMAGSLLMTVPVIVIFFFAQKYFIQGVTLTGMKG